MNHARLHRLRIAFVLICGSALAAGCGSITATNDDAAGSAGTTGNGGRGAAGTSGSAGTSGAAGTSGTAGTSGAAGRGGTTGAAGTSGAAGRGGTTGAAGTSGAAGRGGTTGTAGASGGRGGSTGGGQGGAGGRGGAGGGVVCGKAICPADQTCCNASCGVCTPPGSGCTAMVCSDLKWTYTCGRRLCNSTDPAPPLDAGSSLPPCTPDQKNDAACPTLGLMCDPRDNACERMLVCSTGPLACPL